MTTQPNDVNCLNTHAVIEYARRHFPDRVPELFIGLPSPFDQLPTPELFLSDENNWVPSGLVVKMFENVRRIAGNEQVAFDIGYESLVNRQFSYVQRVFLTVLSSPRRALRRVNQINSKLNTTKVIELVYSAPGRAVIRWHWKAGVPITRDLCAFNRGIYSAISTLWGLPPSDVVETSCSFEGAPYCEVSITWSLARGAFRNVVNRLFTGRSRLYAALEEIEKDKSLLKQRFDEMTALNRELDHKVTVLKTINMATRTLVSEPDTLRVLEQTLKPIVEVLGFDRALIMTVDAQEHFLEYRYGFGEDLERIEKLRDYRIPLDREQNLLVRVLRRRRPVLIRDVEAAGLNPANRILQDFRPTTFAVCPLIAENRTIGILGADRRTTAAPITQADVEYLSIFANNIASAFQRARLDQDLKTSYVSSVRALVQAIEEKDTYTRGHSERVSRLSVELARRMGWDETRLEYLRFTGILHDVGKIGTPESIVRSPKPLTEAESRIIKKHPLKGVEILQPIAFLRSYLDVVRNHHEHWDGTGYPDGLAGEDIPPGAQIVAVADAYDAMTSSRPYRRGLPSQHAAEEIAKGAGSQFSPRVAEAFRLVFEEQIETGKLDLSPQ